MQTFRIYEDGEFATEVSCLLPEAIRTARRYARMSWTETDPEAQAFIVHSEIRDDDNELVEEVETLVEPPMPACSDPNDHDFVHVRSQGHGGGVLTLSECTTCGWQQEYSTWFTDRATGETYDRGVIVRYLRPEVQP